MRSALSRHAPVVMAYGLLAIAGCLLLRYFSVVWVAGGSMQPALMPGDVAVVAKRGPVEPGDIALIRPGSQLVLHRVKVRHADGSILTRGDANPVGDLNPTMASAVVGRVVRVIPAGSVVERWRARSRMRYTAVSTE